MQPNRVLQLGAEPARLTERRGERRARHAAADNCDIHDALRGRRCAQGSCAQHGAAAVGRSAPQGQSAERFARVCCGASAGLLNSCRRE